MSNRTCTVAGCDRFILARAMCRLHYDRSRRQPRHRPPGLSPREVFRYHMPGEPPTADRCWEWSATRDKRGYGVVGIDYRMVFAHRLSYEILVGPIPDGLLTRHTCDNPPCVNPAHLLLGTDADNSDDKVRRWRHTYGSRHPMAKLCDDDVRQARALHADGWSIKAIAQRFGVHHATMSAIVRRQRWKHIQ